MVRVVGQKGKAAEAGASGQEAQMLMLDIESGAQTPPICRSVIASDFHAIDQTRRFIRERERQEAGAGRHLDRSQIVIDIIERRYRDRGAR
jgi:hypothetical protein